MSSEIVLLAGIGMAAAVSTLLVYYLRGHLKNILIDLCGTEPRAQFWMAFSTAGIVLLPITCALGYDPQKCKNLPLVFQLSQQMQSIFIGVILTLAVLGFVLGVFIAQVENSKKYAK